MTNRAPRIRAPRTNRKEPIMTAPRTHTPATIAAELSVSAKTFRKFLRSSAGFGQTVGKGSRWTISSKDANRLKKSFAAWSAEQAKAREARIAAKADNAPETTDAPETDTDA